MKLNKNLNNSLVALSDDSVTYFILVYVIQVSKDSITLRFLDPYVKTGLVQEYQVFEIIGDNSILQKSTGLIFRIHSIKEADNKIDIDEDVRYLDQLTTKDKMIKLSKVKEGDELVYREYDTVNDSYSIPERCRITSVNLDSCEIKFYSYLSRSNKVLNYGKELGSSTFGYFVKI